MQTLFLQHLQMQRLLKKQYQYLRLSFAVIPIAKERHDAKYVAATYSTEKASKSKKKSFDQAGMKFDLQAQPTA